MNKIPIIPGKNDISHLTQVMMFKQIWLISDKRSFLTGLHLRNFENTDLFLSCFAHVLPKGQNKWPYFKHYYRNVVLLTVGEHALYDQGTEEARISYSLDIEERSGGKTIADWAKLKALEEDLKKEYQKYFPSRRGLMIGIKYNLAEVGAIIGMLNERYMESLKKKP